MKIRPAVYKASRNEDKFRAAASTLICNVYLPMFIKREVILDEKVSSCYLDQ